MKRIPNRLLLRALKDRQIESLSYEAEIVEGPPRNGYKTHVPTGRMFVRASLVPRDSKVLLSR